MTTLDRAVVVRETLSHVRQQGRTRPIVIELRATYAVVRAKGTRTRYTITYDQIWQKAVLNHVEADRRERKAARDAKRKGTR